MALLIPPDSEPQRVVNPAHGLAFTGPELQTLIGQHVEALQVPTTLFALDGNKHPTPLWMLVNEEGRYLRLPVNPFATALLRGRLTPADDAILGTALLCSPAEAGK